MYISVCSCLRGLVKRTEFPTAGVTGAVHQTSGREVLLTPAPSPCSVCNLHLRCELVSLSSVKKGRGLLTTYGDVTGVLYKSSLCPLKRNPNVSLHT